MEYAGFFRRLGATIIDGLILLVPSLILSGMGGSAGFGISILIGVAYKPIFESSTLSATPGKALMDMAVVSEAGNPINFKTALIRYLCSFLSMLALYIGYLMQPFTGKRQTLHDMIAETVVIRRKSEDVNYFTVWKEQFKKVLGN